MIVSVLLAGALLLGKAHSLDPTECCPLGYKRAASFLVENKPTSCKPDPGITDGTSRMVKLMCIGMFKGCCEVTAASQFCQMGVRLAAANHMCTTDNRVGGQHQKTCCDCCKRGKAHALRGGSCTDTSGDDDKCTFSFQDCCEMSKPSTGTTVPVVPKTCQAVTCDSADKECVEDAGGATCKCKKGFREEGGNCYDIDECTSHQFNCTEHSHCSNRKGSYECICAKEFMEKDGKCVKMKQSCQKGFAVVNGTCVDVDECLNGIHSCPAHAFCMNVKGTYRCVDNCPYPSYEVVKVGVCADVNECDRNIDHCSDDFECVNEIGSFDCKRVRCDQGYKLINGYCQDIDECALDSTICGEKGLCRNQAGRHYCDCQAGYAVDPSTGKCSDIDECQVGRAQCSHQCINTEGSYRCKCPAGYEMRSRYCYDNDECKSKPCPGSTHCFNTFGSYQCINQTCPNKYYVQTSANQCRKKDCKGDQTCKYIKATSIKWQAFRLRRDSPPSWFQFTYTITGFLPSLHFHFALVSGNDQQVFDIKEVSRGKVKVVNAKPLRGPKKYLLKMHADVIQHTHLVDRYIYMFYIFLSPYQF